jgi:hypothetical protein
MAVEMTYASLVTDISSYLERTDTATLEKIPTFIMLAEQVISSEIQFLGNLTVVTSTMNIGEPIIVKPARWRKTVSVNLIEPIIGLTVLHFRFKLSQSWIQNLYPLLVCYIREFSEIISHEFYYL